MPDLAAADRPSAPRDLLRRAAGLAGTTGAAVLATILACGLIAAAALTLNDAGSDRASDMREIRAVVSSGRDLARAAAAATSDLPESQMAVSVVRNRFIRTLETACGERDAEDPQGPLLARLCDGHDELARRMTLETGAAAIRAEVDRLAGQADGEADALIESMARADRNALLEIAGAIAALAFAGLLTGLLLVRATHGHRNDVLRETIDALPAGVVLYDKKERLLMFNGPAAEISGARLADSIGKTYEELARETARMLEAKGEGPQPVDEWLARFRRKGVTTTRRMADGRWFDWSERQTPSGYTVGLRVDVSERMRHEQALEHARAEYQSLVDSLSDVLIKIDFASGTIIFASAAAGEFFGRPVEQLIGTRLVDHVAPQDWPAVAEHARQNARSLGDVHDAAQFRMIAAGGTLRHIEVHYRKTVDEHGRAIVAGVIRDVEDRVQLERRLADERANVERARSRYQALVDSLSDMVYAVDDKGYFTYASPGAADLLGVPSAAVVGTPFREWVAPEDVDKVMAAGRAFHHAPNEKMLQMQFRMRAADGSLRTVELRYRKPAEGGDSVADGAAGGAAQVGVIRDITEPVELSRRLAEETARLRSIVESSGAMVALVDRHLDVVMVNSGFTAVAGIPAADAIGRPLSQVIEGPLWEDLIEAWREQPGDTAAEPTRFAVKLGATADSGPGGERLVAVTATPVTDAEGVISNIVLLGVDETDWRRAEQALHDSERFATVGEMAGTMAHELSQPLQVINLACASALEELGDALDRGEAADGDYLKQKLGRIAQQVDDASRIVGDLRAFVRGEADRQPGPFDPGPALQRALKLTAHGMRQAGIASSLTLAERLPSVVGDIGRLEQVMVNLLNNARDAGGRRVEIVADTTARDGRAFLRIAVQDSGPGIPADLLPHLFVSFVTTKPRGTGTGLGLRICRRIIEEMGGNISAANRPQGGACFEVLLPAAEETPAKTLAA